MPKIVKCEIDRQRERSEMLWMFTVAFEEVGNAIILLSALFEQKIEQVFFKDPVQGTSFMISVSTPKDASKRKKGVASPILQFEDDKLTVTDTWLQAVYAMLLDVWLNGWNETAHLDADFLCNTEQISICFIISPPSFPYE